MEGLQEITNALLKGTIPDPLWPSLPRDWGFATQLPPLISGTGKSTDFKFGYGAFTGPILILKCWRQESCAIAKMTAQCALHMGALKIFGTP